MGQRQFTDNATALLAATITTVSTVVAVATSAGALYPTLTGSEYFMIAVQDTAGNTEYMKVTAISGDNLTVVRAQEGTSAQSFTANLARVELRNTAGTMAALYQKDGDTLSGDMNGGGHNITNAVLGSGSSVENALEIVNTPLRGATGITSNEVVVPADGTRATAGGLTILCSGDIIPVFKFGMVMMWNSAIPNVPAGWHICDGTNGTPDLRDKFIPGAGTTYTLGQTGNYNATTQIVSGGTPVIQGHTLITAELPAHAHPFDYFFGNASTPIGIPGFAAPANGIFGLSSAGNRNAFAGTNTGSDAAHTHTASALTGHSHTVATVPYYALYFIMFTGT